MQLQYAQRGLGAKDENYTDSFRNKREQSRRVPEK